MSREIIRDAVIDFLKDKNYKYLKPLGEGGFASVIAFLSPQKEVVAVKIVEKKYVSKVEDQVWPWLSHRNILPLLDVLSMDKPDVKLYITPMLPRALDETVHSNQFRRDLNGLTKLKLWIYDALLGLSSLHFSGLCHGDLKTDNILIDEEERAVLCDFSGLNHTGKPLKNVCSPFIFRPPECFTPVASQNVQGVPYDMYTFGLTVLNMLTGHYPQMELMKNDHGNWDWSTYVWPILQKALQKPVFEHYMRRSLPYSDISEKDIQQALDFVRAMMKIKPEERPSAREMMKHPFLKMGGNPFRSENKNDCLSKGDGNPFRSENKNDCLSKGDDLNINPFKHVDDSGYRKYNIQQVRIAKPGVEYDMNPKIITSSRLHSTEERSVESRLDDVISEAKSSKALSRNLTSPVLQFANGDCADKYHPWLCLLQNEKSDEMNKKKGFVLKKTFKQKVTNWFRKKIKKYKQT